MGCKVRLALAFCAALSLSLPRSGLAAAEPGVPAGKPREPRTDRDSGSSPIRITDVLGIADGNRVADVGAGGGWFTTRLARRVSRTQPRAEDIKREMSNRFCARRAEGEQRRAAARLVHRSESPHGPQAALIVDLPS